MADDSRRIGSLIDPRTGLKTVSAPDPTALTKFVDPHLENMKQQVFRGYSSLNDVIDAQTQAKGADTAYRIRKAQYESQNGDSGLASSLGALGSTLIQGYSAYQESEQKRQYIQQEAEARRLDAEEKRKAEEMKMYYEETGATLLKGIDDAVTRGNQYIQYYGWEKGTEMAQTELNQVLNSPQYFTLPGDKRANLTRYYRSQWGDVQKQQTNYILNQKDKIKAGEIDKNRTFIKMSFGGQLLSEIRNGVNPDEALQRFYQEVETWKGQQQEANGGRPLDPNLITEIFNPVYKELAETLQARYGEDAKNFGESYKYVQLEQYNATLEQAVLNQLPDEEGQPMTESRAKALVQAKAIELGISGYSDKLELSNDKITSRQITKLEQAKALEALLNDNTSAVNPDTVIGQKSVAASQGSFIFGVLNGDAGSKSMLAHIKNNRDKYPAYLQNLPEQVDEFQGDRKTYQELQQKLLRLEGDAAKISTQTNPETLGARNVLVPPNADLGTGGGYVGVSGTPSPTALPAEREAILKEMDLLKSQQVELQTKWVNMGMDITNPGNRQYLDALEADTSSVLTEAQTRYAAQETSKSGGNVQITVPQGDREVRLRAVNNASRKNRNEKWDDKGNLRSQQSLDFIKQTQNKVVVQTGDLALGELVGTGMLQQNRLMDEYEALLSSGVSPTEASKRVKAEYEKRVNQVYVSQRDKFKGNYKPGVLTPQDWKNSMLDNFSQKVDKFTGSYNYFQKQFASQRPTLPPSNPNPSKSRQDRTGDSAYSQQYSPTQFRSVGQPTIQSESAFARSNGHFLPVRGSANAMYEPDPGNGGNRAPGIKIKGSSDQPLSVQGGSVVYTGATKDGQYLVVKTPDGRYEGYQGLGSLFWKKGDKVKPGQAVGKTKSERLWVATTGNTGKSTGAHLDIRGRDANGERLSQKRLDELLHKVYSGDTGKSLGEQRGRITSGYGNRVHPVDGGTKHHPGYDYGFSVGTKIQIDSTLIQSVETYDQNSEYSRGGGHIVAVKLVTGETLQLLHLQDTNTGDYTGNGGASEFTFSTWDADPMVGGKLSSRTSDPVSYLRTQAPSVPNYSNGQSGINQNGSGNYSTGIFEISPGVYLMPNGKVMDMKTGQVRAYKGEKTVREIKTRTVSHPMSGRNNMVFESSQPNINTGNKEWVINARKMSIYREDYASSPRIKNSRDDDYGYEIIRNDPDFRQAIADLADELNIPAVWLADQMELETAGWTHVKKSNQWGYTGLIQMSAENMAHYGVSPQAIRNMSLGDQVRKVVAPYLRDRDKYQKIKTMEDLVMSVWAAPKWQRKTPEQRAKLNDGLSGTTIQWYMERMGKGAGRRYNHNYDKQPQERKPVHDKPRQGCPMCQQMLGSKNFQTHNAP